MQTTISTILLILAYTSLAMAQECQQIYNIGDNQCTFYLDNANTACSIFAFQKCQYSTCKVQSQNLRYSSCHSYETVESTDWSTCIQQCCKSNTPYAQNWQSLHECMDFAKTHGSSLSAGLITILILTTTIISTLLIFIYCWCCSSKCNNFKVDFREKCRLLSDCLERLTCQYCINLQNRQARRRRAYSNTTSNNSSDKIVEVEQEEDFSKEWTNSTAPSQKLADSCCICLQKEPSLLLQCGHPYHRECVCQSMRFRLECSLCRSKQFNNIEVYCQECLVSNFKTSLLQHRVHLSQNKQVCVDCRSRCSGVQIKIEL